MDEFNPHIHDERAQPIGVEFNMGYIFAATAIAGLVVSYLAYWLLSNTKKSVPNSFMAPEPPGRSGQFSSASNRPVKSRVQRLPTRVAEEADNFSEDGDDIDHELDDDDDQKTKKKIGVKKAAKLEMKAEKRAIREAMILEREEKKREQEYLDQLRKEEEEKMRKEEEEKEEQERLAREEKQRQEHEAYLKLAENFEVEEEGYDPDQDVDSDEKLVQFIAYIHEQKVVLLEHLAAQFKMKTKDVVDRIQQLIASGSLVGIIDDRGKFISITPEELESVAKFVRQRGRVTVDELVVNSNKLINLKPEVKAE